MNPRAVVIVTELGSTHLSICLNAFMIENPENLGLQFVQVFRLHRARACLPAVSLKA